MNYTKLIFVSLAKKKRDFRDKNTAFAISSFENYIKLDQRT